jgi:hypothetical protein
VQVIAAPDGWPIWTSPVRPGREHDTTALRSHAEALPLLAERTDPEHTVLADLGYEGERGALTTPIKTITGRRLTDNQRTVNCYPRPGRTWELPAQDHLQGATPGQPVPLAHRRDHRRRFGPAPPSARPHHMINAPTQPLLGMAHWPPTMKPQVR